MNLSCFGRPLVLLLTAAPLSVFSTELPLPAPLGEPATRIFRQVMPDGAIVYSDRLLGKAAIDGTIEVDTPIAGNGWTTQPGKGVAIPSQVTRTPVARVAVIPDPDRPRTVEDANAEVIRAEMLLEDARRSLADAGETSVETDSLARSDSASPARGTPSREQVLRQGVENAEQALKDAVAERNTLLRASRSSQRVASSPTRSPDADTVARGYSRLRD